MDKKAIVIFDTNKLLQNPNDKRHYSQIDLGGDYVKLLSEFIPQNFLNENVFIAIPKLCIEEIKQRKIEDFDSKYKSIVDRYKTLREDVEIISNLLEYNLGDINKKETAHKIMIDALDKYISEQPIKIIDYPKDENFKPIIERALRRKTPFMKTKNDGSDKGFKDVVIWHSIIECDELKNFDYHIFYTQDGGFDLDCLDEYETEYSKKMIKIVDFEELKKKLLTIYPEEIRSKIEVKSKVNLQYFVDQLYEEILSNLQKDKTVKDFQIIEPYVDSQIIDEGYELISKINIDFIDENKKPMELYIKTYLDDVFEIQTIDEGSLYAYMLKEEEQNE